MAYRPKPCRVCGITIYPTSSQSRYCDGCRAGAYRAVNAVAVLRWRRANKPIVRQFAKKEHERHRDDYRRRYAVWGKGAQSTQKWRLKHPLRMREIYRFHGQRRRALRRATTIGPIDYQAIRERDGMICGICHEPVSEGTLSFDHIIALANGGPHTQDNLQVAHRICNSRKGSSKPG